MPFVVCGQLCKLPPPADKRPNKSKSLLEAFCWFLCCSGGIIVIECWTMHFRSLSQTDLCWMQYCHVQVCLIYSNVTGFGRFCCFKFKCNESSLKENRGVNQKMLWTHSVTLWQLYGLHNISTGYGTLSCFCFLPCGGTWLGSLFKKIKCILLLKQ